MSKTEQNLFVDGQRYSRDEVQAILRRHGRRRARLFFNVLGWTVFFTTEPTWCTPTGRAKGFPRTCYVNV